MLNKHETGQHGGAEVCVCVERIRFPLCLSSADALVFSNMQFRSLG